MKLVIISGRSGSGKTVVLRVLEDLDYYCIDNLPLSLVADLPEKLKHCDQNVAISIDARNLTNDLSHFSDIIPMLKEAFDCKIIFLDADDATLLKRFSETRRKHPLTNRTTGLKDALILERKLLTPVTEYADLCIETGTMNIRELRNMVYDRMTNQEEHFLSLHFQSFGFKHGVPADTNFIFDIRCLPNPYWKKNLQPKTGLDKEVVDYLESFPNVHRMFEMIKDFVESWIPAFKEEKRKYLTISVGCTGGQHRSVYMTERLCKYFSSTQPHVTVYHRELT